MPRPICNELQRLVQQQEPSGFDIRTRVHVDGGAEPTVLVGSRDFYAAPRISPDGGRMCFVAWDHPDLPFIASMLFEAPLDGSGRPGRALPHRRRRPRPRVDRPSPLRPRRRADLRERQERVIQFAPASGR